MQSCPGRDAPLERLLETIPHAVEVIVDDGPADDRNPWRCYKQCLEDLPDTSHLAILQDDTVACRNLLPALERIAQARPDNVVCLFLGGQPLRTARNATLAIGRRQSYVPVWFRDFVPVVAVLWPTPLAASFLEWSKTAVLPGMPRDPKSDDAIAGTWMRLAKQTVLCTVPSLVQHPDDVESTIGRRAMSGADRGRVAMHWIGDGDPLEIDWS